MSLYTDANELLYHTHALTAVFSITEKLTDAYCHIPIYSRHLNLGFNKGTVLKDPHGLLSGTGSWIRHIPVKINFGIFDGGRRQTANRCCLPAKP